MGKQPFDDGRSWAVLPAGVLALGLAGWMTPAASAPPPKTLDVRHAAPAPPTVEAEWQTRRHLDRVRASTSAVTKPVLLERSPFEFATPRRSVAMAPAQVSPPQEIVTPSAAAEVRAPLPALVGIAEQNEPTGVVRTAIFTDLDGTVRFALVGESTGPFRVASIESTRVTLIDGRGEPSTLTLK